MYVFLEKQQGAELEADSTTLDKVVRKVLSEEVMMPNMAGEWEQGEFSHKREDICENLSQERDDIWFKKPKRNQHS